MILIEALLVVGSIAAARALVALDRRQASSAPVDPPRSTGTESAGREAAA